ncbi:hypothetical protein HRG_013068 [Hirsutella rhossiliensis]
MQVYGACMEASPEGIYYSRRRCWQQLGLRAMSCRWDVTPLLPGGGATDPATCKDQAAEFLAQLKTAARYAIRSQDSSLIE